MRKSLPIFFAALLATPVLCYAWPRLGATAAPVFQNAGTQLVAFSVNVTTGVPIQLYSFSTRHREITIQNPSSTFLLYVGTSSAVNATVGTPRLFVPPLGTMTIRSTVSLWGIYETAAGAGTKEVLGSYELDPKD